MDTARRGPRIIATVLAAAAVVAGLSGCTNAVRMEPAPAADAAACADAQVRLPAVVNDTLALRNTSAQATAAWGSPSAVLYHCGVAVPTVSDLPCFSQGSVDWIRDDRGKEVVYTTFGRSPAVQVVIDTSRATGDALQDLGDAVSRLPEDGHRCLDPQDVD
ncbi:DUF3515 domain-containing protein [Curtobacterium sp. MCJR17_055]|uniref:DUF3515 family protein n=1 Tax=unclassified Curtobacterium TaxID=257496 RepID=UPI000D9F8A7D|nr:MULTISPECIES: DUF3515 family protein [unclassified Curtobacterium]PYY35320.1 DUF3515 domain-containing protein [Curtobacterium sp. MCBD17_029]PYY55396.1 DUF3515 domain-containing protein [Curtobacterium sp. MCJR17_055]PYY55820.1 DUF3515 domain-containing protein [Curtobacterium sp. MCPF17_015]